MLRKLKLRLRALFRRNEIDDELSLHLEQLTAELMAQGLSPREAEAAAKRQFGNLTHVQEQSRDLFSFGLVEDFLRDLRYGWRSLGRSPSVAVAAVLSMGLAIGVNTTRARRHVHGELSAQQIERVAERLRRAAASQLRIIIVHQPVLAIRESDADHLLDGHRQAIPAWAAAGVGVSPDHDSMKL